MAPIAFQFTVCPCRLTPRGPRQGTPNSGGVRVPGDSGVPASSRRRRIVRRTAQSRSDHRRCDKSPGGDRLTGPLGGEFKRGEPPPACPRAGSSTHGKETSDKSTPRTSCASGSRTWRGWTPTGLRDPRDAAVPVGTAVSVGLSRSPSTTQSDHGMTNRRSLSVWFPLASLARTSYLTSSPGSPCARTSAGTVTWSSAAASSTRNSASPTPAMTS